MVTLRIEFMDGKEVFIDFSIVEDKEHPDRMYSWQPTPLGLLIKAHKQVNRLFYPWHNIRSYALHNAEVKEYRDGARPAEGQ